MEKTNKKSLKQKVNLKGIVKYISAAAVAGLLIGSTIVGAYTLGVKKDLTDTQASVILQAEQIENLSVSLEQVQADLLASTEANEELLQQEAALTAELEQTQLILTEKDEEIISITAEIEQEILAEESTLTEDGMTLGGVYSYTYSDRDIDKLFDGEYKFDGDNYDVEEVLTLTDVEIGINGEDFEENSYLLLSEDSVEYSLVLDTELDTSLISENEELNVVFLGEDYTISDWTVDTITYSKGTSYEFMEGEEKIIDENIINVRVVGDNFVYLTVNGVSKKLVEGETEDFEGVDIKAETVVENNDGLGFVELVVGKIVSETVEDGDEYSDDSVWDWVITPNSIGMILNTDFTDLDGDEKAIGYEESISLPNDYLTLSYGGIVPVDMKEISFKTVSKTTGDYVKVSGDFIFGLEDYDELYVNETGFYNDDFEYITNDFVKIDGTDSTVELIGTTLKVEKVKFPITVDSIKVEGVDISSKDDDYRAKFGIIVESPEDNIEDNKVSLQVPEEKIETEFIIQ